jgi:hypothetical protein
VRDLDDLVAKLLGHGVGLRWVAVAVAGKPHESAGSAFGQAVLAAQPLDCFALDPWG